MSASVAIKQNLVGRWQLSSTDVEAFGDEAGWWVEAMAISLMLGCLFNENANAERAWLHASRREFGWCSAMDVLRSGLDGIREVRSFAESERP